MQQFNTFVRLICSLAWVGLWVQPGFSQSVLNFPHVRHDDREITGVTVVNSSSNFADVRFTFHEPDGSIPSVGLVNAVSYRIPPKGKLALTAGEVFEGDDLDGWIQATSRTSGLEGSYLTGDFVTSLSGTDSPLPMTQQILPLVREGTDEETRILVVNPSAELINFSLTVFGPRGSPVGTVFSGLGPFGLVDLRLPVIFSDLEGGDYMVRIDSSIPVIVTAVLETAESSLFLNGQPIDRLAASRIIPYALPSDRVGSELVLANPTRFSMTAVVSFFRSDGEPVQRPPFGPSAVGLVVPGNGFVLANIPEILGAAFADLEGGWIQIDSLNVPLNGFLVVRDGNERSAASFQDAATGSFIYPQFAQNGQFLSRLVLVNTSPQEASVDLSLVRQDGTTLGSRTVQVTANASLSGILDELFPSTAGRNEGFVVVRSSVPIHGALVLGSKDREFWVSVERQFPPPSFAPDPPTDRPEIQNIEPREVRPGTTIRIAATNFGPDAMVLIADQFVSVQSLEPPSGILLAEIPLSIQPGFVNVKLRSGDRESLPVSLGILSVEEVARQTVEGRAFYEKVEIGDDGLDFSNPTMVPIRNAKIEVVGSEGAVLTVSETDAIGRFQASAPLQSSFSIRVISANRHSDLRVVDNTNGSLYAAFADPGPGAEGLKALIVALDSDRTAGAFNVLEVIQRGNDFLLEADPAITPPAPVLFWSPLNTSVTGNIDEGAIGTTHFDASGNTAFLLGDRQVDSDEFDDSVILHEYAHMVAALFSRDDSTGGDHFPGDVLDPRSAWSEGWANFFSTAVRNNAIYRDSRGPNGTTVVEFDVEDNSPPADRPGYWSEFSVHSLLWDLIDENQDDGDLSRFDFSVLWPVFVEMRDDPLTYLGHFLDRFVDRYPQADGELLSLTGPRAIDFLPFVQPSLRNSFPRSIQPGQTAMGEIDSLTSNRTNLLQSAHVFSFETSGDGASIRLDIVGLGPGGDSRLNDLDVFLMDSTGRLIRRSDRGLNGQSELIAETLPAGNYVIEIRSYYTDGRTGHRVFNSGSYRLSLAFAGNSD